MPQQPIPRIWDSVSCSKCSATAGERCRTSSGSASSKVHEARWRLFYRDHQQQFGPLAPAAALLGVRGGNV